MSALAGIACWRRGVPHVFTLHGSRYYADRLDRRLTMAWAGRAAHQVVAVSDAQALDMARDLWLSRERIRVIPNGIPPVPAVAPSLRAELGLAPEARLVVAVGNLYPVKGHAHLLRAVAALPPELRQMVHVAIAGRGDEGPSLTALAAELGLPGQLHLLGLRDDVANVLRSATVFALPSLSEALPLALLEAMRAGVPVVASAVGEIPAVLEHGKAGLLARPGDPGELASALRTLLSDPTLARALVDRAQHVVLERYAIERMAERYLSVYAAAGLRPPATRRE
jgi:glycosyltransferase involved in cell wall biosynthesis